MSEEIRSESVIKVHAFDALDKDTQQLVRMAEEAAKTAYAPYSNFLVGAAVVLDNGEIVKGHNQENAAYPSGLCAERVAFFAAHAQFPTAKILKVALTAKKATTASFQLATPCGSCRQVMSEFEDHQKNKITLFISDGKGKVYESGSIENLLPFKFSDEYLK
ncbi:cytidine deaminase [Roseivirga pacifica]|uniref:cytidine deaminase n=1 Tax=Roseivirga pacifica TaxID=1267423 RepID=UPI0020952E6D|nr:cytidine deaminase [Roseivirga pacifica]MCO6358105.1 cytidine deaminase [Roseivirga pacifica]MCO6366543.1 cytidine deaminase [Roseivirga pacifica]MCO6371028.1 cytidine deaminase [Roseivirga pacifica]MCO6373836.1 cytidine deaminase [Roseivirga pacifica]MCO6380817.1 cytidine deaminase [Roseivirga pacifica]